MTASNDQTPDPTPGQTSDEADTSQWAVRAANGTTCHSSPEVARAAVTEGGYTLGVERSPIVAALYRATAEAEWREVDPDAEDYL